MGSLDTHLECKNSTAPETPPNPSISSPNILNKSSSEVALPVPSLQHNSAANLDMGLYEIFDNVDLGTDCGSPATIDNDAPWNTIENITAIGLSLSADRSSSKLSSPIGRFPLDDNDRNRFESFNPVPYHRFQKWIRSLQSKAVQKRRATSGGQVNKAISGATHYQDDGQGTSSHKKSLSGSSLGFVTAVKSASISLASFNVPPRSRRTGMSSRYQRTDRSSRASNGGLRLSEDSSCQAKGAVMDEAVNARSIQRRQVLEEIINTEEGYVIDVRFLMNVYITLLASIPTISPNLRTSINQNLNEIIELHEDILRELHRVVPHSDYNQVNHSRGSAPVTDRDNGQSRGLDLGPKLADHLSWLQKIPSTTAEANVAADVARVFGQKMHRFFVYEEYGAKYEMMVKDVASTYRTIPQWDVYQKGLEALASSLSSINHREEHSKKSLTVGDLLVKPIQRVCRYPLMFAELLKHTPVCDCPDSHMEIEKVLARLRETTAEINKATDDPRMKATMEKTWILQDRLMLTADPADAHSKATLRTLGHIHLCGVLHVAWQTRDGVDGQYMISLLYRDCLVLASAGKVDQFYAAHATIGLSEVRIEEADNGRGLQCHTAPFSWKLVFECDHQLYEIILTACSPKEELEWRSRLTERICKEQNDIYEYPFFTNLSLGIKPMGTVFGKPDTIARRISIHRATTIGPKSSLCQVLIKNTSALKEVSHSVSSTNMNRSQSLLSTNRIPVLAPSRAERVRLENLISDVWTREILPFPGMTSRSRSEHLVRASASSMMRKLSVASITSNFTKRSGSYASLASIHHPTDGERDADSTKYVHAGGWQSIVPETSSTKESDDATVSRLSVIQDENLSFEEKVMSLTNTTNSSSPVDSLKRLATPRMKKSWQPDGSRIITPPLRTSSANSIKHTRTTAVGESPCEGNENKHQPKHSIWAKATGIHRGVSTEGIRGFFR